ncbi:MAG: hypothetical protein EZS28_007609 [Streblomastix strix]|uniref:Uncharacterized protein n=1 Tax=Streblomastix strix TaxID=222440 RepID=A0A5J4WQN3_9EUKA|nr:MAG: hypothetical protein EZS28_007609 [Streblomastix strix]
MANAALEGWDSTLQIQQTEIMDAGSWQKNWHLTNNNQRETEAVLVPLRMHNRLIEQNQIHSLTLYTDNQTVEYNLRRWRSGPNQIHLVRLIIQLLEEMNIQLTTIHIPDLTNNKDRSAKGKRGALSINWTNQDLPLRPPIELIPGVLKKMKLKLLMALFLLPSWCFEKFKLHFHPILQIIKFGLTELVLKMGKSLESHQPKFPPGDQLAVLRIRLVPTTIQQMIDNLNWETWRKRRAGLIIMARYLKLNEIVSMPLYGERPDIHVVNAMAQLNDLGDKIRKSNFIALKTHTGDVHGQFSKTPNISYSPLIKQFTRCMNKNIDFKARYNFI